MPSFFRPIDLSLNRLYPAFSKIAIAVIIAISSTYLYQSRFNQVIQRYENIAIDWRFKSRSPQAATREIVVIQMDDKSIRDIGALPWDREWHATLITALSDFGAQSIGFDVLFTEASKNSKSDLLLAQSMTKAGNVYLPVAFETVQGALAGDIIEPLPLFQKAVRGQGHITITPDQDGLLRRIKLRLRYKGQDYLQLGFKMALDHYGARASDIVYKEDHIEIPIPRNPSLKIPITSKGDLLINWVGRWEQSFLHVSYIDVIVSYSQWLKGERTRLPPEIFKDAICIVGVTATGLFDIRAVPLEPAYPAVGVNATVLNSILERKFLKVLSEQANLIIIWVLSFLIFAITLRFSYAQSVILISTLAAAYLTISFFLFVYENIVTNVVYPLFLIFFSFTALTTYHQIVITIEKRRLLSLATKDSMTGLLNIGHFKLLLGAELNSIKLRRNKELSIIMVDVDFFKKINDTFGHAAGDDVLRAVAEILKEGSRSLDVVCRYGGEEFILMLPGASGDNTEKVADKMRKSIEERKFFLGENKTERTVTASFGVSTYKNREPSDDFIKRSDKALYEAKDTGRNKVCRLI